MIIKRGNITCFKNILYKIAHYRTVFRPVSKLFHFHDGCNGFLLMFPSRLLAKPSPVLKALGARLKYECVVGVNGRVWVKAADVAQTIIVVNAVRNSEFMSEEQCRQMVEQMLKL